jgi:uncharacterized protein YjdB/endonuclease I
VGNTYGDAFLKSLYNVMVSKGTATGSNSYSGLNAILAKSDAMPDGSGTCAFYRQDTVASSWNKEHVWPNSRGAGENAGYAGTDPQVIRPTNTSDNSSRSNYMYGETTSPSQANGWDPNSFGYNGARGEAARIIFYAATRYYNKASGAGGSYKGSASGLTLTNNLMDATTNATMGKLSTLLTWNNTYAVTRAETYRNDYLTGVNYARNPFIDHPDWANYIWDANGVRTTAYTPAVTSSSSASTSYASSSFSSSSSSKTTSSSVVSSSSSSSISGDSVTIYPTTTNMPTSYPTSLTSYSLNGLDISLYETANYSSKIQFHKADGYMLNAAAFSKSISSIVITGGSGTAPTVTYGSSSSLGSTATSSTSGTTYTYTLGSGADFFKIMNGSTTFTCSSITFNFVSAASVAVTGVSLSASTASVAVGSTTSLTATVSPSDATNKNVTWSSSNTSIATVSSGVVSGVSAGNATITVTTADGGWTDTCTVTVSATTIDVTAVAVSFASSSIYVGQTTQASVAYTPSNATNKTGTWTSDDETVASVNSSGVVTAVGVGSTYINFESNDGPSDYALITVTAAPIVKTLSSIAVSGATASATFGSTYSISGLVVTATYSDGTTADVTTSSTIDKPNTKVIGPQNVGVSYAEDSVTKTATYAVSVTTVGADQGGSATVYSGSVVPASNTVTNTTTVSAATSKYTATGVTLSSVTHTQVYGGGSTASTFYKLGSGSNVGKVVFTLPSTLYIKSMIVTAKQYSSDTAAITVSDGTTSATTAEISGTSSASTYDLSSSWASNVTGSKTITVSSSSSSADYRFYFGGISFTYTTTAASTQNFTDAEEATAWATYFTTCTQGNCHGSTIWDTVSAQYAGMSDTAKAYFVAHESSDTTIKAAYDRYTFARAQYGLTDFIGGSSGSAASLAASNNASYWALGAVLSVFALTTIGYISFSFKKKHQ